MMNDDVLQPEEVGKRDFGYVSKLCFNILRFVRGDKDSPNFDESIKEQIEFVKDENGKSTNELHSLTKPDYSYLSETNIECIDAAIAKYDHLSTDELVELSKDKIYDSYKDSKEEISEFDMLKVLDKDNEFSEQCLEIFNKQIDGEGENHDG
jgi:hypothetical protein